MSKWKKGQSGNPSGRPKRGYALTDLIKERMDKNRFVDALLTAAYAGDVPAIKLILSYVEGPPLDEGIPEGARVVELRYVRSGD